MTIAQSMIPEFENEMASTRKMLEAVPAEKLDFRPHEKSMTLANLAGHVAEIPGWIAPTIQFENFDLAPVDGPKWEPFIPSSPAEALAKFDEALPQAKAALEGASDEAMMVTWSLTMAGQPIMSMPRVAAIRGMVMNHMIHHRAQLSVYLRLLDVKVPGMYGPSADEPMFG